MVSNLYDAKTFYQMQKKGEIGRGLSPSKKLRKDSKGFYLTKSSPNGSVYKQRISQTDKVYSRSEGVTAYSKELDKKRKSNPVKESKKQHDKAPFDGDRQVGNRVFKV